MRHAILGIVAVGSLTAVLAAADPIPLPPSPKSAGKAVPLPLQPSPSTIPGSPDPFQLRSDTAALARDRQEALKAAGPTASSTERAVLRAQLMELLKRLNERPAVPGPGSRPPVGSPKKFPIESGMRAVDSVRMAENLFRDGDYDAALRAFRLIDRSLLGHEDRAFVQYMTACCLRKMNKRSEAAVIYREVAEAREDEFISECAISQLALIRSTQELEAQLEQLRSRPKSR